MTDQDQIVALAELDGLEPTFVTGTNDFVCWNDPKENARLITWMELPKWLNSRDASVELRLKVCGGKNGRVLWLNHARVILHSRTKHASDFDVAGITPREDCEAILRATGKWKE
jgi:hypothetical protein